MAVRRLAPDEIQPEGFAFSPENDAWAERQIAKYPEGRQMSAVIPLLTKAQEQAGGWLPQKAIEYVADRLRMPYIRALEVATFYTMFNLEPVGRHFVQLCGTTPCALRGANELKATLRRRIGEERHVSADGLFSWLEVECLGACCNAPMVQINEDYYEDLTPQILERILDDLAAGRPVKPGPQQGRVSSEPAGEVKTLTDPALYDGSMVGAWRSRFEDALPKDKAAEQRASAEAAAATATAAAEPKPAKPDTGRVIETPLADTPAARAAAAEPPIAPAERQDAADPTKRTVAEGGSAGEKLPSPHGAKSYVATPVKPQEGRVVADAPAGPAGDAPVPDTHRPPLLDKPRGGRPDDLKLIRGIGAKLEALLHELGVFHFDQIAGWTEMNLRWIDQHLGAFKGRALRDNWIEQAKKLAARRRSSGSVGDKWKG